MCVLRACLKLREIANTQSADCSARSNRGSLSFASWSRGNTTPCGEALFGEPRYFALEELHLLAEGIVLRQERLLSRREVMIVLPPIETHLFGFVDRTDDEADTDG